MSGITFEGVFFSYDEGREVLRGVNLTVGIGESVAIVGQNGAGKTTLVKMMNGILKPTSGTVTVDGMDTQEYATAGIARRVAYVYQNPDDQIFNNTVRKELSFAARYHRLSPVEIERNVAEAAAICEITELLDENPYNIPYSVRKLIGIASVLVCDPEYLILDEPTAGQDRWGLGVVEQTIRHMTSRGKTVVTITHDMDFAALHFGRVIAMAQGNVQFDGIPTDLFWNDEAMDRCRITAPTVTRLGREAEIPQPIIRIKDLVAAFTHRG